MPMLAQTMTALELTRLDELMALSDGHRDVAIGLVDGPVAGHHPDLAGAYIWPVSGTSSGACTRLESGACAHGTFVAGMLVASRTSKAPAICPGCTLLVRPIFWETAGSERVPMVTPDDLAQAVVECVDAGARVVNLSAGLDAPSTQAHRGLHQCLDYAAARGTVVVAAAGNQGTVGSSVITRHPWVIPVVACDSQGRAMSQSNLCRSIGARGLGAPGEVVRSLRPDGGLVLGAGTSAAAAFVTGAIALLWSLFPTARAVDVRHAVTQRPARTTVAPPLLDAGAAYATLGGERTRQTFIQ